ncbi:Mu transposase C-terminal domain-containing protein [Oleiharenicola lentus]|nr:Mu transposase C-terminal domain-containing protein [Oleiharenicola lentus]
MLIHHLENDHSVIEYYDQPVTLKLVYLDADGRKVGCFTTPDFAVAEAECAYFVEAKTEEDLRKLAEEKPNRYVRQQDGSWRCPPGEEAAAGFGMGYRIVVADLLSSELTRNIIYLEDYSRRNCPAPAPKLVTKVLETVKDNQGITYPALLAELRSEGLCADDLNNMIYRGTVYVDLRAVLLIDHESVRIFSDQTTAVANEAIEKAKALPATGTEGPVHFVPTAKVRWKGTNHTITHVDDQIVHLMQDGDGKLTPVKRIDLELDVFAGKATGIVSEHTREQAAADKIATAGPARLQEAVNRWQTIQPYLEDRRRLKRAPKRKRRTFSRWIEDYREAQDSFGNGFVGLLPEIRDGRAGSHLDEAVDELMIKIIKEYFETNVSPTISDAYGKLLVACQEQDLGAPSLKTFGRRVRLRPQYEQTRKRKGGRPATQRAKFYFFLDQTTPVHGDRPFEIAHIDHTELDLELVCPRTGKNLGRPWLTLMIDARTRRILATHVSLFAENTESCMMVMRECVRRHHRLPQTLVVDNGKGFNSLYFEVLLANFGITKKSRPAGHPRFGSVCERIFGTINTQFIHNLRGNTKLMKNVRQVSKEFNPKTLAAWALEELDDRMKFYCHEVYDTNEHSSLGRSPRDEMAAIIEATGRRQHTFIPYNFLFQVLTLPSTKSGVAKVHAQKGVHINYLDYWNSAFTDPKLEGTQVPVRYDPWDSSVAYAFVHGAWLPCISSHAMLFKNYSQRALKLAAEEYRARRKKSGQNKNVTALRLAKFMAEVKEEETFLILRAKEVASRGDAQLVDEQTKPQDQQPKDPPVADQGQPEEPADQETEQEFEIVNE